MKYISATDAKQALASVLEMAQREPVTIQRKGRNAAVMMSIADYERLSAMNVQAYEELCDRIAASAKARGLTEEKLAAILADE